MTFGLLKFAFAHEGLNSVQILMGASTSRQATETERSKENEITLIMHSFSSAFQIDPQPSEKKQSSHK